MNDPNQTYSKRSKTSETYAEATLQEVLNNPEDYVCQFNLTFGDPLSLFLSMRVIGPPNGAVVMWREIDEDEENDEGEDSSDEEFDHSEHFYNIALTQYNEAIAKDPDNLRLIARRDALIEARANINLQQRSSTSMES